MESTSLAPTKMFQITTTCPSTIKQLVTVLATFLMETVIQIQPQKIIISDVDSAGIIMVYVTLHADKFNLYECKSEGVRVGVDLNNLNKYLKMLDSKGVLSLSMLDDSDLNNIQGLLNNQLIIQGTNMNGDKHINVRLNTRDIDLANYDQPDNQHDIVIDLPTAELKSIIDNLKKTDSELACITYTKGQLLFKTYSSAGSFESIISIDQNRIVNNAGDSDIICECYLDVGKLSQINKCASLSSSVTVSMTNGYPLSLKYNIGELGEITILISPATKPDDWIL